MPYTYSISMTCRIRMKTSSSSRLAVDASVLDCRKSRASVCYPDNIRQMPGICKHIHCNLSTAICEFDFGRVRQVAARPQRPAHTVHTCPHLPFASRRWQVIQRPRRHLRIEMTFSVYCISSWTSRVYFELQFRAQSTQNVVAQRKGAKVAGIAFTPLELTSLPGQNAQV